MCQNGDEGRGKSLPWAAACARSGRHRSSEGRNFIGTTEGFTMSGIPTKALKATLAGIAIVGCILGRAHLCLGEIKV